MPTALHALAAFIIMGGKSMKLTVQHFLTTIKYIYSILELVTFYSSLITTGSFSVPITPSGTTVTVYFGSEFTFSGTFYPILELLLCIFVVVLSSLELQYHYHKM